MKQTEMQLKLLAIFFGDSKAGESHTIGENLKNLSS